MPNTEAAITAGARHLPAPPGLPSATGDGPPPPPHAPLRGLSSALLLLLAIGLLPALAGTAWYLNHMRVLALRDAFAQADLLAIGTTERLRWLVQDAQAVMSAIAQRPRVRAMDGADCDPLFRDYHDVSPTFKSLCLRRVDGGSLCSALQRPPSQQVVAASPWFQTAVQQPGFYASGVHPGDVTQPWAAKLTYPVKDAQGQIQALLITPVDLKQLQQRLFTLIPPGATVAVLDSEGRVLVRSVLQDERLGKPAAPGVARVLVTLLEAHRQEQRLQSQVRQFVEVGISGTRSLFVLRSVPLTEWTVVVALPEDATLQTYRASRNSGLLAIALILLAAAAAAWRVSRAILVPIRGLAQAARSMAKGATVAAAPESGPREIREVAREFNRMVRDIADSAAQLRASEKHYRMLIENLPVAVVSYTADGGVETVNLSASQMLQSGALPLSGLAVSASDWLFLDLAGLPLPPDQHPVQRVLRSAGPMPAQALAIALAGTHGEPTGPPTWVVVTAHPQIGSDGRVLRVILVLVDATTAHHAEQFRIAKEAAEAASRAKSAFLSRVSHELRTPLNAINGFSELMLTDTQLGAKSRTWVGHVLKAGRHLLLLIDQILDLTRVETGPLAEMTAPVPLWALLEECLAICSPLAQARGVVLQLQAPAPGDFDATGLWVQGDATRLRQVLMNLLSNAIKYNRRNGQVQLSVRCLSAAPGEPDIAVEVCDTGLGLSEAQIENLFQPFNRLGAEHRGIEGNGLGLLISRMLAQSMRGDIRVRSVLAGGSCFTVVLHRAAPGLSGTGPVDGALPPAAAPVAAVRRRQCVLYIEDNVLNRALMRQILALRDDIDLFEAVDGAQGLQLAAERHLDLVLIDIGLPGLDGFAVLEQLRQLPDRAATPCWAVTADTSPATASRAAREGFDRLITKPVSVAALLAALESLARPATGGSGPVAQGGPPAPGGASPVAD